jgi:hypothetical protein
MSEEQHDSEDLVPFPEPVHYSRTDNAGWIIRDWATANKLLSYLEPEERYFAVFTLPDYSYVQCYGCKTSLTVEARTQHTDGTFAHWVFGAGPLRGIQVPVGLPVGPNGPRVTVDESQLLTLRDARVIIRQFLNDRTFCDRYHRQDVSARFNS